VTLSAPPRSEVARSGHFCGVPEVTTITPYQDGPLLVRGNFRIVDEDGVEVDPGRATVALCRCGRSRSKPFCDGTHVLACFKAPSGRQAPGD
jgi:CDGSH-type Zn-finger protein